MERTGARRLYFDKEVIDIHEKREEVKKRESDSTHLVFFPHS